MLHVVYPYLFLGGWVLTKEFSPWLQAFQRRQLGTRFTTNKRFKELEASHQQSLEELWKNRLFCLGKEVEKQVHVKNNKYWK